MCSMNISPTTSMNAIIRVSIMSSPSPASNQVVSTGPFENPSGWAACSISTSALPDPLPLPQPFRSSAHASRPACLHPLSLPPCVTAPWKIFNQHLSPMQPLLPRMYILTIRDADARADMRLIGKFPAQPATEHPGQHQHRQPDEREEQINSPF